MTTQNNTSNKRIALVATLFLLFTIFLSAGLVLAADITPPALAISLSQDNVSGQHNDISYSRTIYAHLYNIDSQSGVSACQINWSDGWVTVDKGTSGANYTASHTYSSDGVKTISYQCQNGDGYWSNVTAKHISWDSIDIQSTTIPPSTAIFMGQDNNGQHKDISYSLTVYANLWNNDSLNNITACEINWSDGVVTSNFGSENTWYGVSHTYASGGIKNITYKCQNDKGTWSSELVKHTGWDSIDIQTAIPPAVGIYLGEADSSHNSHSYFLTVYANLWNNDSLNNVTACQIDWSSGVWQNISVGTEDTWYSVSHTYATYGDKVVNYRCQNDKGTWSSGSTKHLNWDNLTLQTILPVITIYSPTVGNYNVTSIPLQVGADQSIATWIYNLNNGGNITFTPNTTITAINGSNTIIVYGINANGTASAVRTFNVNTSLPADNTAPVLTNVTTNPVMPFSNNGSSQNVVINFTSDEYPINMTFHLYNSTGSLINTAGPTIITNVSQLPVTYVIPFNLTNGTYILNLTVSDSYGNTITYTIGNFSVNNIVNQGSNNNNNNNPVVDDNNNNNNNNNAPVLRAVSSTRSSSNTPSQPISLGANNKALNYNTIIWTLLILVFLSLVAILLLLIFKFGLFR